MNFKSVDIYDTVHYNSAASLQHNSVYVANILPIS